MKSFFYKVVALVLLCTLGGCRGQKNAEIPLDGMYFVQWDAQYTCTKLDAPYIQLPFFYVSQSQEELPSISRCHLITTDEQSIQVDYTISLDNEKSSIYKLYTLAATLPTFDVGEYQIEAMQLDYRDGTSEKYDIGTWNFNCIEDTLLYPAADTISIGRHDIFTGYPASYNLELTNNAATPLKISNLVTDIPTIDETMQLSLFDDFITPTKRFPDLKIPSNSTYAMVAEFTYQNPEKADLSFVSLTPKLYLSSGENAGFLILPTVIYSPPMTDQQIYKYIKALSA